MTNITLKLTVQFSFYIFSSARSRLSMVNDKSACWISEKSLDLLKDNNACGVKNPSCNVLTLSWCNTETHLKWNVFLTLDANLLGLTRIIDWK